MERKHSPAIVDPLAGDLGMWEVLEDAEGTELLLRMVVSEKKLMFLSVSEASVLIYSFTDSADCDGDPADALRIIRTPCRVLTDSLSTSFNGEQLLLRLRCDSRCTLVDTGRGAE